MVKKLNVKIRNATLKDLKEIFEIEKASFPKKISWNKKNLAKKLKNFPEGFFLAEIDKKIVGYIFGEKGEIQSLAVLPEWRRRGIGTFLLKTLLNFFRKTKIKNVILQVKESDSVAISFYKKNKFKIIKKIEKYYSNGEGAFLMKLTLF